MKPFFIFNPSQPKRLRGLQDMAQRLTRQLRLPFFSGVVNRQDPLSLPRLVHSALASGCTRLILVGGDGTLNQALNSMHSRKALITEIAIVPAGTCNDFARTLGLKKARPRAALRASLQGLSRAVDLGDMNGVLFINNAGFGRRSAPTVKRGLSPLRTLRTFQPLSVKARWEGGSLEGRYFMGLACNAPYFSAGLHFSRDVNYNDGLLDVFLVPVMAKSKIVLLLAAGRLGRPVRARGVVAVRTSFFEVESPQDLWPQADGEAPQGPVHKVRFSVSNEKAMIVFP